MRKYKNYFQSLVTQMCRTHLLSNILCRCESHVLVNPLIIENTKRMLPGQRKRLWKAQELFVPSLLQGPAEQMDCVAQPLPKDQRWCPEGFFGFCTHCPQSLHSVARSPLHVKNTGLEGKRWFCHCVYNVVLLVTI